MNKKLSLVLSAVSFSAGLFAQDALITKERFQTNVIHSFKEPRDFVWLDVTRKLLVDELFDLPTPVYKAVSIGKDSVFFYCHRIKDLDEVFKKSFEADSARYESYLPISDSTKSYFITYFAPTTNVIPDPTVEDSLYNNVIASFKLPKPTITVKAVQLEEIDSPPPPPPPPPPRKRNKKPGH